jgi:hypothetical protein
MVAADDTLALSLSTGCHSILPSGIAGVNVRVGRFENGSGG